jgi:Pentapeptide repeats (8 copies)
MSKIVPLQHVVIFVPRIGVRFSMVDLRFPTKKQAGQGICLFVLIFSVYGICPSLKKLPSSSWIQLITGLSSSAVTLLVAAVGYRNYKELQRNNEKNATAAEKNYQALIDKNTADRFSKAVEQLGHENIHVRLRGIFALEQIANTEDLYYWQIMEILTAYVRTRSPWPQKKASQNSSYSVSATITQLEQKLPVVEIDIETVMTVISRRRHTYVNEPARLDLTKINLQGLIAKAGADFQGIDFSEANLSYGQLKEVRFSQTMFKNTDITGVHFTEAVPKDLPAPLKKLAQFRYDAENLTLEQLSEVKDDSYKKDVVLPSYLEIDSDESQQKIKEFQNTVTINL